MKILLSLTLSAVALALYAAPDGAPSAETWPFIVIRHTSAINESPETFERLIDCHRRHRGACDEFWFSAGGR